jgi:gamma-glutamyl:cysteine ligase YbdK (ATP-grasp superfamily)
MIRPPPLGLFAATGVELEYMIVDADSLDIRPLSDELIRALTGTYRSDVDRGPFTWSNELVLHVLEFKTTEPAPCLRGLATAFQAEIAEANLRLRPFAARLLPTAMHPWMDPACETRLWPHEYSPVYAAYDRIFGCAGHGWSNLQSLHLNLPFANDQEFARLHAAIRALLPLLPALAASSPVVDGRSTGWLDQRLAVYRTNSARLPSVTGQVIPEPAYSRADYERDILEPMYRDIAPWDPDGILQDEFLNSRGAIARFGRGSIEIRVLDVAECPAADLAIAQLIVAVLRALAAGRWLPLEALQRLDTAALAAVFLDVAREADAAIVRDPHLLAAFGRRPDRPCAARDLWRALTQELGVLGQLDAPDRTALEVILEHGCLARRILAALEGHLSRARLAAVYRHLADCLAEGRPFLPRSRSMGSDPYY